MAIARLVEPEWLDELPADDARAMHSRRDLKRINALMFQAGIMARLFASHSRERPRAILEIGAGDGTFMLGVARRLAPRWPDVKLFLLDQQDIVKRETRIAFDTLGWHVETITADVFAFLARDDLRGLDAVSANLFLHHFSTAQLADLFRAVAARTPLFVACEPRRNAVALMASRLLWAIGCNDVTRHDALASVRAGFHGADLSALWPDSASWTIEERSALLFTHAFVAKAQAS